MNKRLSEFLERYQLPSEAAEELRQLLNENNSLPSTRDDVFGIPAVPDMPELMPAMVDYVDEDTPHFRVPEVTETQQELPAIHHLTSTPSTGKLSDSQLRLELQPTQEQQRLEMVDLDHEIQFSPQKDGDYSKNRFERLGPLGEGGMGEVFRVRDKQLNRTMAMKVLRRGLHENPTMLARFIEEAQACAQLEHPGILPVYELGKLDDGRYFFTMQEVRGRDLGDIVREVHQTYRKGEAPARPQGWTFRRLIETYRKVVEAIAYAHSKGVLHRDIKPQNIMIGKHGEALVVDWGLAKVIQPEDVSNNDSRAIRTIRTEDPEQHNTEVGILTGTPTYMSPEQAQGDTRLVTRRSDIYSLGAILYEILSGRPPYLGDNPQEVHMQLLMGPPAPMTRTVDMPSYGSFHKEKGEEKGPPLPGELVQICQKAMERDIEKRYPNADALAQAITYWLEGAQSREKAVIWVNEARNLLPEARSLVEEAERLQSEAFEELQQIAPWEGEERKVPSWNKQDTAQSLKEDAEYYLQEAERLLYAAVNEAPTLSEAHVALLELFSHYHKEAEAKGQKRRQLLLEKQLQTHLDALVPEHPAFLFYSDYLYGKGSITLLTSPTEAGVVLYTVQEHNRRLILSRDRTLGESPLRRLPMARGNYVLSVQKEGYAEVRIPFLLKRKEHWAIVPPEQRHTSPLVLPEEASISVDECFVAAGWFTAGSKETEGHPLPMRDYYLDSFVMQRFPVTNREYLHFLNALQQQDEAKARACAPRHSNNIIPLEQQLLYQRNRKGQYELVGDSEQLDWPVVLISWEAANDYARWWSQKTLQEWKLPSELEWEKAARGTDARTYPWGNEFDPSWGCMCESFEGVTQPSPVHAFPIDESVYGIRGLGGNVRGWCRDTFEQETSSSFSDEESFESGIQSYSMIRGGAWLDPAPRLRTCNRYWLSSDETDPCVGFRLVRHLPSFQHD